MIFESKHNQFKINRDESNACNFRSTINEEKRSPFHNVCNVDHLTDHAFG